MKQSKILLLLAGLAVLPLSSCVGPGYGGPGYASPGYSEPGVVGTVGVSYSVYDTLPSHYVGDAYYYGGRYYSGGRYETGNYHDHGRVYTNRYQYNGQYFYGGRHENHGGGGNNQHRNGNPHHDDNDRVYRGNPGSSRPSWQQTNSVQEYNNPRRSRYNQ